MVWKPNYFYCSALYTFNIVFNGSILNCCQNKSWKCSAILLPVTQASLPSPPPPSFRSGRRASYTDIYCIQEILKDNLAVLPESNLKKLWVVIFVAIKSEQEVFHLIATEIAALVCIFSDTLCKLKMIKVISGCCDGSLFAPHCSFRRVEEAFRFLQPHVIVLLRFSQIRRGAFIIMMIIRLFFSLSAFLPTRLHSLYLQALYRCSCWAVWACWRWCQVAIKGRPSCCRATVPETQGPSWGAAKGCMDGAARSAGRRPARWMNFLVSDCVLVCVLGLTVHQ